MSGINSIGSSSSILSAQDLDVAKMSSAKTPKLGQKFESKEKLEKAAHEFEGVFMDVVMKQMRETVGGDSDAFGDNKNEKFFQSMLDTEYSKISSAKTGMGLAAAIVRQMMPRIEAEQKESQAALAPEVKP